MNDYTWIIFVIFFLIITWIIWFYKPPDDMA